MHSENSVKIVLKGMYVLWSLDRKKQEVFYQENFNWGDVLRGMLVFCLGGNAQLQVRLSA
jgi:hypothetical protein